VREPRLPTEPWLSLCPYAPKCPDEEFRELRLNGFLGSTYSPGPTPISVPGWDRHSSGIIPMLGTFSTRFSALVGAPPGADRRRAARVTEGMPSCVAKWVSPPIRNREVRLGSRK
jgi:hypothetical protein